MAEKATKIPTVFDSDEQQIGEVYARALLGSVSKDKIDLVVQEFQSLIVDVLDKHPKLEMAMANPKLSAEDKSALIDKIFKGKMDGTLVTFLKVLGRRQRLNSIRAIQGATSALADEMAGRIQAVVTVSDQLNSESEQALVKKLETLLKKQVRIVVKVDPQILGGLVVRIGDTVYDGSIDGQLRSLRKVVTQRAENAVRSIADSMVAPT